MSEFSPSSVFVYSGKPSRVDKIVKDRLGDNVSREKIKRFILEGYCFVNGQECHDVAKKIYPGQEIAISIPKVSTHILPEEGALDIVYRDAYILVVNKPAGLTVHPAPSCPQGTLLQRLLSVCPELQCHEGWRPGIVHRLDKDTSGLLIVAPDETARLKLTQSFAKREVNKTYLALVSGVIEPASGSCKQPIGRHLVNKTKMAVVPGGRPAHTEWTTLYVDPAHRFSLLAIRLHTGRTHQIRVHMAYLGYPLLGDKSYAPHPVALLAPRQMLHAWRLEFRHPLLQEECSFVCPPPRDIIETMLRLSRHCRKIVITGLPGCGKSRLTKYLAELGYPVWSADDAVKKSYEPGNNGWLLLDRRYAGEFTSQGKPVDKVRMAAAIRNTPGMRQEVESIIHPLIYGDLADFWNHADDKHEKYAFAEVPLWFEMGGNHPRYSPALGEVFVIGVDCPQSIRHDRLLRFRNWLPEMIMAADNWQLPEDRKMGACNYLVNNAGTEAQLFSSADDLLSALDRETERKEKDLVKFWQNLWSK